MKKIILSLLIVVAVQGSLFSTALVDVTTAVVAPWTDTQATVNVLCGGTSIGSVTIAVLKKDMQSNGYVLGKTVENNLEKKLTITNITQHLPVSVSHILYDTANVNDHYIVEETVSVFRAVQSGTPVFYVYYPAGVSALLAPKILALTKELAEIKKK